MFPSQANPPGGPEGRLGFLSTTCTSLRGPRLRLCELPKNFAHTAAAAWAALRGGTHHQVQVLCAALPQPPPLGFGHQSFPPPPVPTQGLPRGCGNAPPGPQWASRPRRCRPPPCRVPTAPTRRLDACSHPSPGAPSPASHATATGRNTFSYLLAAEDHTLRSALSTLHPLTAEQGDRTLLLFPGAGRSVRGQGPGDATELGI